MPFLLYFDLRFLIFGRISWSSPIVVRASYLVVGLNWEGSGNVGEGGCAYNLI